MTHPTTPKSTKPKNRLETESVTASITPGILALLEKLTDTHFFGRNVNETASQILTAEVKRIATSGELDNLISKAPVTLRRKEDDNADDST